MQQELALPFYPTVKLQRNPIDEVKSFLDQIPFATLRKGRKYFAEGRVIACDCIEPERLYAALVEGSTEYEVGLEFDGYSWAGSCTCPLENDCKHVVAAMLSLQEQLGTESRRVGLTGLSTRPTAAPREAAQTAGLEVRLREQLGRKLKSEELRFIRLVQAFYHAAKHRQPTEYDLRVFANSIYSQSGWQPIDLWPAFPRDEYICWLYLAWELRRRGVDIPDFIAGITDFSLIEKEMREWDRQKAVAEWIERFRSKSAAPATAEPACVDLRVVVLPQQAQLQWRMSPAAPFADVKKSHAKKLGDEFEQGTLAFEPDSLPIWSATYKPFHYESWWTFEYSNSGAHSFLNRLLRLPLPAERIVTADGLPLARPAEPLRLELRPPEPGEFSYELVLVTSDGATAPPIWCVLSGEPALYLTAGGLYHGPRSTPLGAALRASIPSAAIETNEGVRYLYDARVPLPPRLRERVSVTPVRVAISARVKPIYPGSSTEDIALSVTAKAPGMSDEVLGANGWRADSPFPPKPKAENGPSQVLIPDRAAQRHFPALLDTLGAKCDPYSGGAWTVRLTKKAPELFAAWLKTIPPDIELILDKELATLRDNAVSGTVSLDVAEAGIDWFDLKVALNVTDTTLTPEELRLLLNARGGYVRLANKGWRRLQFDLTPEENEQLANLGLSARDFSAEPQRFHALQLANDAAKKFLGPDRFERIQSRASEIKTRVNPPQPGSIRAELRPYQTEGFHFLAYLASNRFGGVLADDMGLGKTLQTLAWLAWLRESAKATAKKPSLVVCPKSVMDNWRGESERFYPGFRVRIWRGEPADELASARSASDLIVMNYPQLRSLSPAISRLPWFAAILDEAQCIKNPDSQTAQAARALNAEYRLALTGTPIENRLLDLWSIFGFAMPGVLGNRAHFLRSFDVKDDPLARRRLAARVRPFLLRRTKTQVARDLPDRVEEDLFCEMEGPQQTLYRAELKRARQAILGIKSAQQLNKQRFSVLTSLLRLRQICCHPALVDASLQQAESAKVAALEDLIEPLMEEGHKVLVFSQFVTMLDLLKTKMQQRGWPFFFLAGDTENRGELVQQFQSAQGGSVFLISLKAGGFGLNLTAASYVVLFDPWWNPAVENQAIDRTHRIGQTTKVIAYRLLIRDSIEQKIRDLQKQKAALAEDVLGEERFAQSLSLADLQFLFAD